LMSFTFELFINLAIKDPKAMSDEEFNLAVNHVRFAIQQKKKEEGRGIRFKPSVDSCLIDFAKLCLLEYIPKKAFIEFVGISKEGDFLFNPSTFNYDYFECSWIIDLPSNIHTQIARNENARKNVKIAIQKYLDENVILDMEQVTLTKILLKHYV